MSIPIRIIRVMQRVHDLIIQDFDKSICVKAVFFIPIEQ